MGIYLIDCTGLSEVLVGRHGELFQEVCELFVEIVKERATVLKGWYQQSIRSLTSLIIQIDEFVEQKNCLDKVQSQLPAIKEQLDTVKVLMGLVETNMPTLIKNK